MAEQKGFLAWRRQHALAPGTPCRNCGTVLMGPWCHACGQSGHDFQRHARHLIGETLESFFHADGRLWRTLPRLVLHPSRLTRDYLDGKRAPQIPPLRLFLVVLLILFVVSNWQSRDVSLVRFDDTSPHDRSGLMETQVHLGLSPEWDRRATDWLHEHIGRAMSHPDELSTSMRDHAEDFAFLMLPISALILAVLFIGRRAFVLFDHLIFSMHSLSFQGLLISTVVLLEPVAGLSTLLLWAAPVHLFAHMRGTYRTSVAGTLFRMAALLVASCVAFALLLAGLVLVGLGTLRA